MIHQRFGELSSGIEGPPGKTSIFGPAIERKQAHAVTANDQNFQWFGNQLTVRDKITIETYDSKKSLQL